MIEIALLGGRQSHFVQCGPPTPNLETCMAETQETCIPVEGISRQCHAEKIVLAQVRRNLGLGDQGNFAVVKFNDCLNFLPSVCNSSRPLMACPPIGTVNATKAMPVATGNSRCWDMK